ncbi:VCBS repeat-containing protein [Streptomyces roseirectus]|uniref:VCBS repeat-containing protein n=1 Tax=Streptomyces roseirectus TaxID=2768066 RepID=A0A7H0I7Q4_9ACTN|nr:GDSL-type esterase/lipase family protein [Streptomyces roseirectus]QNP68820.1 VCBS repeat-containing protein [Streptomyces roseirectus]
MQGQHTGTGKERESRYRNAIQPRFTEGMQVLALQEAGNEPPLSARESERVMPRPGVHEFIWNLSSTPRADYVQIYYSYTGQQRNGLAIVTRDHAQDAVQLNVHSAGGSRPMMGVLLRGVWYFTAHASSEGGRPNDAEDIIETARQFMARNAPNNSWMVLADFNLDPGRMLPRLQRTMVRPNQPTHQGGSEIDWAYTSDSNQTEVDVTRLGLNSDHWLVRYVFGGCRGLAPRAASTREDSRCGDPVPGHAYRLYLTEADKPESLLIDSGAAEVPWLAKPDDAWTGNEVRVLFATRPGTYKLRMGDRCLGRSGNSRGAWMTFDSCDPGNMNSDWSFSDGRLLNPYADAPLTAGPGAALDDQFRLVGMVDADYRWRFEEAEQDSRPPLKRDLRLMPLGDSITAGLESSDSNGYRQTLHSALRGATDGEVDFVGSGRRGTMTDPDHEGHPGRRIDEIASVADCTVPRYRPNVITLHVGTNDANQNYRLDSAPQRIRELITQALQDSPKAVVVVARLIPTGKPGLQPRIDALNAALPRLVSDLRAEGKHVVLVDTSDIQVDEGLQNDAHPDDQGYAKLGRAFYRGVMQAADKEWIAQPEPQRPDADCEQSDDPDDTTALGEGWRKLGVIAPGMHRPDTYGRTEIAEMNGDQRADYVQIRTDGSIRVGINTPDQPGQPTWKPWGGGSGEFFPAGGPPAAGESISPTDVRLADIDGDGRDDFVDLIGPYGDSFVGTARLNTSRDGDSPAWDEQVNLVIPTPDAKTDRLHFADVNGDGRDDVLRVGDGGEVHAYLNTPTPGSSQPRWEEKLSWAPGVSGAVPDGLRFADVDNDGKADYLMVGADGSVHAYLNKGGKDAGGFEGHHHFANASNYAREYVQFKDISGDGKADYLVVYDQGAVRAWLNRGGNR